MQIQINTDRNVSGREEVAGSVESIIERALARFDDHITRVEVHLSDENGAARSGTPDKRCQIEVRVAGRQPISVTELAESLDRAVNGASQKMVNALDSALGKLRRH